MSGFIRQWFPSKNPVSPDYVKSNLLILNGASRILKEMNWRSFIFGLLAGSGLYATVRWMQDSRLRQKNKMPQYEDDCFLFSPHTLMVKCVKRQSFFCKLISCPVCNYKKFLTLIKSARSHLDVCVYLITSEEITRTLLSLFSQGVFIRIIIDKQMSDQAYNSKMCVFMREHIPIKIVRNGEIMHNKFVIIDQKVVVTGSFNWTKQGTTLNYENGVIIQNTKVVGKFNEYFKELWLSADYGT